MHKPEPPDIPSDEALKEKIEELESLIELQKNKIQSVKLIRQKKDLSPETSIPILNDLVTENDFIQQSEKQSQNELSSMDRQLTEMIDNIESKLTGELDKLVDILKKDLKDNITQELRSRLNTNKPSN